MNLIITYALEHLLTSIVVVTITATRSTTTSTASVPQCTTCTVGEPVPITFTWPPVYFTEAIVATVIYQINTKNGYTTSTTKTVHSLALASGSGGGIVHDVTAYWESKLSLSKVSINKGTPTAYFSPQVPTSPHQYLQVTTAM